MKRALAVLLMAGIVTAPFAGCDKKSEVKTTTSVKTPEGSTTQTDTSTTKTSGENPPATK
jgi:hypothetical protein